MLLLGLAVTSLPFTTKMYSTASIGSLANTFQSLLQTCALNPLSLRLSHDPLLLQVLDEKRPLTQSDLVHRIHSWGINLRLLGFVRALFRSTTLPSLDFVLRSLSS